MGKVGNATQQGYSLLNGLWNRVEKMFDGGKKSALDDAGNEASAVISRRQERFLKENPNATQAEIDAHRLELERDFKRPISAVDSALTASSTASKIGTGIKFLSVGAVLGATGLLQSVVSSGMTLWENSQNEAGTNSWYFKIFNFIAETMKKFGLDEKWPGAYEWIADKRDKSLGDVGGISTKAGEIVNNVIESEVTTPVATVLGLGAAGYGLNRVLRGGGNTPSSPGGGTSGPSISAADEVAEGLEDAAKSAPRATGRFGKAALGLGLVTAGGTLALTTGDAQAAAPSPDVAERDVEPVVLEEPTNEGNSWFYDAFQSAATFTTGVVTGIAAIPEDLYDAADTYIAQGYLPGDENASGTRDGIYAGAEAIGIDVSNNQGAAALGELSSIFIPVAGIAGGVAKGARATQVVGAVRGMERASDGLGLVDLGSTGAKIARDSLVPSM